MAAASPGTLFIVATPIGNLADLTPRAAQTLANVQLILCEDTRHTAVLLRHLGIRPPLWSLHAHNEDKQIPAVVQRLRDGDHIALVSDAGTPCLSDPGAALVAAVAKNAFPIQCLPGPFAAAVAIAASGLTAVPFAFWGFLPKKSVERQTVLRRCVQIAGQQAAMTHAFYVPGRDLAEVVADVQMLVPTGQIVIARELTKLHEGYLRGTASEVAALLTEDNLRGEAVLLIELLADTQLNAQTVLDPVALVRQARAQGLDRKKALQDIALQTHLSRRHLYALWIAQDEGPSGS